MIEIIEKYSVYFAAACIIFSQACNAVCDWLIFKKRDSGNKWHYVKWGLDRPLLFIAGLLAWKTVYIQFAEKDWWHYTNDFIVLVFGIISSFFVWQIVYRLLKRNFF